MIKKMCKGLIFFLLVVFMAGSFYLIPKSKDSSFAQSEQSSFVDDSSSTTNSIKRFRNRLNSNLSSSTFASTYMFDRFPFDAYPKVQAKVEEMRAKKAAEEDYLSEQEKKFTSMADYYDFIIDHSFEHTINLYIDQYIDDYIKKFKDEHGTNAEPGEEELALAREQARKDAIENIYGLKYFYHEDENGQPIEKYGRKYFMEINDVNDLTMIANNINILENADFYEMTLQIQFYDYFKLHDEYFDSIEQQQTFLNEVMSQEAYDENKFAIKTLFGNENIVYPRIVEGDRYSYFPAFAIGTYSLEADIDLRESLWTPINSFLGVFYGNGHTISNITVADVTIQGSMNSLGGLFCSLDDATICDLILDGSVQILTNITDTNVKKGILAGRANNSVFINCFDKTSTETLPSIGYFQGNASNDAERREEKYYFFTGNTIDGESTINKNYYEQVNSQITYDKIGEVNKYYGEVGFGYVIVLKSGEGKFKTGNNDWYEKDFRFLVTGSENNKVADINRSRIYSSQMPKYRVDVEDDKQPYIINPGKKAVLPEFIFEHYSEYEQFLIDYLWKVHLDENGNPVYDELDEELVEQFPENILLAVCLKLMTHEIVYNEATISTNFNYGYGYRNSTIELPYDTPFCEIFDKYPGLKQRAGYNFEKFYTKSYENGEDQKVDVNIENADDFKNSYPNMLTAGSNENETYYFDWTYNDQVQRNFGVRFAYSLQEGGKIENNFSTVDKIKGMIAHENGVAKIEGLKEASAGMLEDGIIYENADHFAEGSDSYKFKITLAKGYRLGGYKWGTIDKSVNFKGNQANKSSGPYPNFLESTGEGFEYNGNETKNNDFYDKVETGLNWLNYSGESNSNYEIELTRDTFYYEKEYEVTLDNVVGPGGYVVLVIERDNVFVDLTPHLVDIPTSFSFHLKGGFSGINENGEILDYNGVKLNNKVEHEYYDEYVDNLDEYGFFIGQYPLNYIGYAKGRQHEKAFDTFLDENGNKVYPELYYNDDIFESDGTTNFFLMTRLGEDIELKISSETIGRFLLNIETDNFMLSNGGADESVFSTYKTSPSSDASSVFEGVDPENNFFDKWDVNLNNVKEYANTFRPYIGAPKTKIAINLYKGDVDNREALDDMTGVGVSINNSSYFQNVTGELFGMSATGVISSKKSGKYQAYKVVISDLLEGTDPPQYSRDPAVYSMIDSGEKYSDLYYNTSYISPAGNMLFKKAFTHEEAPLYVVDVYYKERAYDIKVEYYAGSNLTPVSQVEGDSAVIPSDSVDQIMAEFADNYFSQVSFGFSSPQLPSILAGGGKYNFSFMLSDVGRGALSYAGYELYQDGKLKVGFNNSGNPESWEKEGYTNSSLVEPANPGTAEGNFELSLGGYDTTIKIFFEYRTVSLLIDKVHVLDEEGYLGVGDKAILAYSIENLTYKIGADGALSLSNGSTQLASISIHSQFYLLGWYLQNGKSINVDSNGNFNGFLTDGEFVSGLAQMSADKEGTYVSNDVAALVGRRTVSAKYNAGTAEHGKLYENSDSRLNDENRVLVDAEDGTINRTFAGQNFKYNESISLSKYAFYNLGYSFNGYIPNGVTVNGTMVYFGNVDNDNMRYSISAQGWDELFKQAKNSDGIIINNISGDSFQAWNGLAESMLQRKAEVELICRWQIISYSAIIDETTIVSSSTTGKTGLSIGDTIYFTTTPVPNHKNGLATYVISGTTLSGQTIFGYYAKGFSLSQDEVKDGYVWSEQGEANKITITPEIFLSFIKDEYRFAVNSGDDNIFINTIREEADYLIYLDNSENDYYRYDWNENLDTNDYGEIIDGRIAIHVKFNNVAQNLLDAISDGVLVISRYGYSADVNLWSISSNGGQTVSMFKPQEKYLTTADISIVPTWIKDKENATKSEINFVEDVGETRNFYLLNDYNIITAKARGNHVEENINILSNPILKNGEQIVGVEYQVTLNGGEVKTFANIKDFNISNLDLSGGYLIKYIIKVKDTLTKYNDEGAYSIEYSDISRILTFNMVKNELYFFDHNLSSIYNASNDFSPSSTNNFGKFMLKYDWKGEDKTKNENLGQFTIGQTEEYFNRFEILGDFNASANANDKKDITLRLNPERPILGKEGANFANLIINVLPEDDGFKVELENVLTIEKAKFTIHFPNGSAYKFDNINALVYENLGNRHFSGDYANGKAFSYTFNKIMLLKNDAGFYTGSEDYNIDKDIFNIYGLEIEGDITSNYEWNIANFDIHGDSRFLLKGIDTAKGYTYNLAYLVANYGRLNSSLTSDYLGETDVFELSDLKINGKAYNLPQSNQGNVEIDGNILFSFVGNGTSMLKLFVNDEVMALYPFTVKLNIRLSQERANALKLLTLTNNTNMNLLEGVFDSWKDAGYVSTISPSVSDDQTNNYTAVLTDVVKVNVDYNTGMSNEGNRNETIYVSVSNNTLQYLNPIHNEGKYLTFNGYNQQRNSRFDITFDEDYTYFTVKNSGSVESITAKWQFSDFEFDVFGELSLFANESEIEQKLESFIRVDAPNGSTLNAQMLNSEKGIEFSFNSANGSFIIKDKDGMAGCDLSDTYTVSVTLTYNDGFGDQTLTKSGDVTLAIRKRMIYFYLESEDYTYNNSVQNVNLMIEDDGKLNNVNLQSIPKIDNSVNNRYNFHVNILDSSGQSAVLKNAGTYTIRAIVDSRLANIYQFENNEVTIDKQIVIKKYTISLQDFNDEINFVKYVGTNDPVLRHEVEIEHGDNSESVAILFGRENGGAVGSYLLINPEIIDEANRVNYALDLEGFEAYLEIQTPNANLQVELKERPQYVYNSLVVNRQVVTVENNKFILSLYHNDTLLDGVEFELYYLSVNGENVEKIYISDDAKFDHIKLMNFTFDSISANAGDYNLSVSLNAFEEFTYSGIEFVDKSLARLKIEKKTLNVTSVSKRFNRDEIIGRNDAVIEGIVEGEEVYLTGRYSQIIVGQNIKLLDVMLGGANAGNYVLASTNLFGQILTTEVESVAFDVINKVLTYGEIKDGITVEQAFALTNGYRFSIGNVTDDINKGYVQVSAVILNENDLSTGGYLKAGRRTIKFLFTSDNFTGLNSEGYEVTLNIEQLELDLSGLEIVKMYDENTLLPSDLSDNIDQFILTGDILSIDLAKGGYQTSEPGEDKAVTIVLKGEDSANYKVKDNVKGTIKAFSITVTVNATTEHTDLVSGGKFVNDKLLPTGDNATYIVDFPHNESVEEIYNSFKAPSRKGYVFSGWKIKDGDGYITFDTNNFESVMKALSLNSNEENLNLTIYAVWEIEKYEINISGLQIKNLTFTATNGSIIEIDGKKYIEYFSDVQIEVESVRGYKIRSYNLAIGQSQDKDLTDIGKNNGIIRFGKIASEIKLDVTFDQIQITFNIDPNLPQFTNRVDTNTLTQTFNYFDLQSMTRDDLASLKVTDGTYNFIGYSFEDVLLNENSLKELIDDIFEELDSDKTIVVKAGWQGERYIITFDPTEGIIEDEASKIVEGVYGEAISSMPSATLEGRAPLWKDKDGKTYAEGDPISTIGEKDEDDAYHITLTADWISQSFDVVITFDEGLTIKTNGQEIANGTSFGLVYGEDSLTLEITAKKGYGFIYNENSIKATIEEINGRIVIKNLFEDGVLHFTLEPNVNTLTLFNTNVDSFEAFVNGEEVESQTNILARTGEEVEIVYKAKKGYNFSDTSYSFRGDGKFTTTISEDGKTLTVVWSEFTANAIITVDAVPSINKVTIGDVSDIFMRLTFGTTNINLSGDTFMVKTGETFVIYGVMAYGYTAGIPNTGVVDYVVDGSVNNYYSEDDKYYHFTATIAGFDEDFAISFLAKARSFNFHISVMPGQEEYGQITCDSEQTVDFGSAIVLSQNTLLPNFEFAGWMIDEQIISKEGNINFIVSSAIKDALERNGENGIIEIFATFARKARDISLTARTTNNAETNKNGFVASQVDENISVEVNGTTNAKFFLGLNLDITLKIASGYELDYVLVDGSRIDLTDEKYHFDGNKFAIALDLNSTISSIEIVFKAGEIDVIVQAGTIINYVDNLGTDAGGCVWVVDKNGDRLGNDVYKEYQGKLLLGANYKILSHTDEVLYFEVEAKEGFTASISTSVGIIVNELNINDKKVYAVMGATNDSKITVLFTARENKLKVIFSNEGEEVKSVHGGVIVVDTKSALVSSNPSRGDNVNVSIVTGGTLNMTVSSMISYSLVTDEDGNIKYDIIGGEDNGNVIAGKVESQDPVQTGTGFTATANLTIRDVISDGTVVIYVKPKEYSVKFVVDVERDISVTMTEKVRYGEEWNLDSLSASDKGKIFASKKDFTFTGYFTAENSYGEQYIDRYGEVVMNWQHSGYTYDGSKYKAEGNFDPATDTFTLYAGWIFNRASVRVEVVPVTIANNNKDLNIRSFATNINSFDPWIGQEDLWYAEVGVGSELTFTAPKIDGYVFVGFTLQFEGGEEIAQNDNFKLTLEMGNYIVRARYNPTINIKIKNTNNGLANGGNSFARQDGGILNGNYDINKLLSLVAVPNTGYRFLYWIDNETEEIYQGSSNSNGEMVYEFTNLIDRPLSLTAVFEGRNILVNFESEILGASHKIIDVKVNGREVDYKNNFTALVGDTIVVRIKKTRGYGFDNSLFDCVYDEKNDCYVFTYTFAVEDLTEADNNYSLLLSIPVTKEDISMTFNTLIINPVDSKEPSRLGYLDYVIGANKTERIENGKPIVLKYGDTYNIRINPSANYAYQKAYLIIDGALYDVSKYVSSNILQINKEFMDRFFDYNMSFNIYFTRLLWTDEDARASAFVGNGTNKEPYKLASAKDFALMAYLVNNGLENEDGVKYSKCVYKVTNDIDFYGRFWEPVGTEENSFAGRVIIGKHTFKNVSHFKSYSSPSLSISGLFWHVSKDAKFEIDKQALNTVIIVVCVLIFVIILIVLIIILLTIRRKKKLEKLANQ